MAVADPGDASLRPRVIAISLAVAFVLLVLPLPDGLPEAARCAGVIGLLMAAWWMTEAAPLFVTALLPLVAFPLLGVASLETTAEPYAHPLIFLFLGGFMLAAAMQRWQLHTRLAMAALRVAGDNPRHQVLAMMTGTAFLSLWVSNTATTMVMVPIGLSIAAAAAVPDGPEEGDGDGPAQVGRAEQRRSQADFATALLLGIAFAATIGGMGSLIGTPPNALFAGFMEKTYGISIGFGQWMLLGLPVVGVLLPITWLLLTRYSFKVPVAPIGRVLAEGGSPPPLSQGQWIVAVVMTATAVAWVGRPFLASATGLTQLSDAGIAMAGALTLFLIPDKLAGGRALLTWQDVKGIRWDVLILFGGGLALAGAIQSSGLAAWIGGGVGAMRGLPLFVLLLVLMATVVYLGELASNTAMAALLLPVVGASAVGLGTDPMSLTLPVALAASLGFMLPVATPPNAIVYGTGHVSAAQMLRAGAILDVISILVVFAFALFLAPVVFPIEAAVGR